MVYTQKGLKLVGLDFDTVTRNGIIENNKQKGRLFEIYVLEHFENKSKDLSGENQNSPCDGICPKGHIYDVKSSYIIIDITCLIPEINLEKK